MTGPRTGNSVCADDPENVDVGDPKLDSGSQADGEVEASKPAARMQAYVQKFVNMVQVSTLPLPSKLTIVG